MKVGMIEKGWNDEQQQQEQQVVGSSSSSRSSRWVVGVVFVAVEQRFEEEKVDIERVNSLS